MTTVSYNIDGLSDIKNGSKNIIIKIDNRFISSHEIINKNFSLSQAKKAIAFELESNLLDDIKDLEFFIKKTKDIFNILIINKEVLTDLKKIIKEKKLIVVGAYADFMFLPQSEGKVSYIEAGDNITFRKNKYQGGAINKDLFFEKFNNKEIEMINSISTDYKIINFLQYNIKEAFKQLIKPWLNAVLILILILITNIIFTIIQNNKNTIILKDIEQRNQQIFKQMFPNEKVVDIKIQSIQKMSNVLKQKQLSDNDFISALIKQKIINKNLKSISFDKTLELK